MFSAACLRLDVTWTHYTAYALYFNVFDNRAEHMMLPGGINPADRESWELTKT